MSASTHSTFGEQARVDGVQHCSDTRYAMEELEVAVGVAVPIAINLTRRPFHVPVTGQLHGR